MQLIKSDAKPTSAEPAEAAKTPVGRMFAGRSVFITGASGFIGRVLLEKLLRSYEGIVTIYILMRTKKNQNPLERLHKQLLKVPIFDVIRAQPNGSKLLDKIKVIPGDIGEPNFNICEEDMKTLLNDETLSIVFHSAATIKFDEPLKVSVKLNLVATKTLVDFCKRLPNLISFVHVSTAYTNSHLKENQMIEEKVYPMREKPEDLIQMAQIMDEKLMQTLKVQLVDQRPNTYTYTKALTEQLIIDEAADLPIAIVRPSIVVASWRKPIPGWVDNLNGPTGLILAIGKGLLRTMHVKHEVVADVVPVDVVVNTMIASGFYVAVSNNKLTSNGDLVVVDSKTSARQRKMNTIAEEEIDLIKGSTNSPPATNLSSDSAQVKEQNKLIESTQENLSDSETGKSDLDTNKKQSTSKQPPIVHCNSGELNPITWGKMEQLFFPVIRKYPSCQVLRYPFGTFKSNYYHDLITRIFVHILPALLIDLLCGVMGKKRQLLPIYFKLHCAVSALSHFCTHNYNFKSNNMKMIRESLSELDRQDLYMDIERLDWLAFWDDYTLGARRFVLKEEDHTLPEARKSFLRAYYIEMCLRVFLAIALAACCLPLFSYMGSTNVARVVVQRLYLCCS